MPAVDEHFRAGQVFRAGYAEKFGPQAPGFDPNSLGLMCGARVRVFESLR